MILCVYWCYIKNKREKEEKNLDEEDPNNVKLSKKVGVDINDTEQGKDLMNNGETV
jgi:hypothetical protein